MNSRRLICPTHAIVSGETIALRGGRAWPPGQLCWGTRAVGARPHALERFSYFGPKAPQKASSPLAIPCNVEGERDDARRHSEALQVLVGRVLDEVERSGAGAILPRSRPGRRPHATTRELYIGGATPEHAAEHAERLRYNTQDAPTSRAKRR